jgi:hypothetical protein
MVFKEIYWDQYEFYQYSWIIDYPCTRQENNLISLTAQKRKTCLKKRFISIAVKN